MTMKNTMIVILACLFLFTGCKQEDAVEAPPPQQEQTQAASSAPQEPSAPPKQEAVVKGEDNTEKPSAPLPQINKTDWNLVLVNYEHPFGEDTVVTTAKTGNEKEVDERILPALNEMIAAAKQDGVELFVDSAYRSVAYQKEIMEKNIKRQMDRGYNEDAARLMAESYVSTPGYSEHHTGLAVDILTPSYQVLDSGYAKTDAAIWLSQHASDYGFILRYPKDKTEFTQIEFEPWHYRYVGIEHAKFIMNNNLCFEEYLLLSE